MTPEAVGHPGVRHVAVIGSGSALWSAAIALHRAFARTGLDIRVVERPARHDTPDATACLPDLARFHKLLGVAEADLLREADATFSLGQQFAGWSDPASSFLHCYGETGKAIHALPFLHFWVKARAGGLPVGYEDFALNAVAARHGQISGPGVKHPMAHGYHLDVRGYERLLRRTAIALGIAITTDADPRVEVADGRIARIRTSAGHAIEADLFVDATGIEARLLSALDPAPELVAPPARHIDRMLVGSAAALSPLPLYSRIAAHDAGWLALFPLGTRTSVAMAYAHNHLSDDEAAQRMAALSGLRLVGEPIIVPITDRVRTQPWIGNCIAVGTAACAGDPLDAVTLHAQQIAIAHLVSLMPIDRTRMLEADIYNDEVVTHYRRLRDFQAAHYRLNARAEPFWQAARAASVSDDLEWKIALFAARGMVAQYNHETFNADSWQTVVVGHDIIPRSYDPQADAVPDDIVAGRLRAVLGGIKTEVAAMIPHEAARAEAMRTQAARTPATRAA